MAKLMASGVVPQLNLFPFYVYQFQTVELKNNLDLIMISRN
jgi:hypothetical protein